MINLSKITDLNIEGKRVLVRADLDVETSDFEKDLRIQSLIPTLNYLKEKNSQIIIIGHKGRPSYKATDGKPASDESLSLKPLQPFFDQWGARVEENLRFYPGESLDFTRDKEAQEFAQKLASLGEVYVNEAFASSHRNHTSIVGVPQLMPHAAGFHFIEEVDNLSKVLENPKRPLVVIIGGVKEDKLTYIEPFARFADKILVGGKLPQLIQNSNLHPEFRSREFEIQNDDSKIKIAKLIADNEDITIRSIEAFEREIVKAGTIVFAGPMGKFEEEGHYLGTKRVFEAVVNSSAFKVAGGGDTEKALQVLSAAEGFDWISVGGGAMLEFLTKGTLPGIEVLRIN